MRKLLSYTRQAVDKYQMIQEGDKIAVGVSGGKDSVCLALVLHELQRFYPRQFELQVITLDMGFPKMDYTPLKDLFQKKGIPYTIEKTQIAQIIFDIRKEENPCSLCAKMRRGALHEAAKRLGCNKVALGHHNDDVIETFFLCLFYESRIGCFSPVTYLDRSNLYLIRPFVSMPEKEIKRFVYTNEIPIVSSTCPADGNTKRQEIKEFISELKKNHQDIKKRVFRALEAANINGWKP